MREPILLITPAFPPDPGGVALASERLASYLGLPCTVLAPSSQLPPGQTTLAERAGFRLVHWGTWGQAQEDSQFCFEWIRQGSWSLIHAYYPSRTGLLATFSARCLDIPVLLSLRGNDLDRDLWRPDRQAGLLWSLQQASALTAVSRDLHRKAGALVPGAAIFYIPNSVDGAHFSPRQPDPDLARQWGLDLAAPVLAFVGEARQKKGLPTLLEAFRRLSGQRPDCQLVLLGGVRPGQDTELLLVFCKQHPALARQLRIIPWQGAEVLPALYALFDLLLFPSYQDGLANALLEAMACSRCVLAAAVGGFPDVIQPGVNGFLVPPYDAEALASQALHLLDQPQLRFEIGQAARQTMLEQYGLEREIEAVRAVYQRLLAGSA